jgi:hypothetical protein
MRIPALICFLVCAPFLTAQEAAPKEADHLRQINYYLETKPEWKIRNIEEARNALFGGFAQLGAKGISAYWTWSIRDAIVAPSDMYDIGIKGDVIWIGQYNSTGLHPFAFVFLNARTGVIKVVGELPIK